MRSHILIGDGTGSNPRRVTRRGSAVAEDGAAGHTHTLIFTLSAEQFALTSSGDPVWVQYGMDDSGARWSFGSLNKGAVN